MSILPKRPLSALRPLLLVALAATLTQTPAQTTDNADLWATYGVDVGGSYANLPLASYTAAWWQWAFSMPNADSPMRDVTGKQCALNQSGEVWFIGGAFGGGKVRRTCTIPHGKALFFPVITTIFYARPDTPSRCEDNTADAAINNDHLAYAEATLNGIAIPRMDARRERSPGCFHLFSGERAAAYGSSGYPAAVDGYWLMLRPLPPGDYTLKFRAQYHRPGERFGSMAQDVEYQLIIPTP